MFFRFIFFALLFVLLVACASPTLPAPANIFTPRVSHQVLNYDDKIWVLGGYEAGGKVLNDVWFSDDGRAWQQATANASWQPRRNFGSVVFNDKMWLLGGFISEDSTVANFNDIWDSTNGRDWNLVTSDAAWSPRGQFDSFIFKNKIWIVGGSKLEKNSLSPRNNIWNSTNGRDWQLKFTGTGRFFNNYDAVIFENKIWIFNGWSNANTYVWYSSDGVNYTQSHLNNFYNFTALAFQNKIWLLGGRTIPDFNFNRELINFNPDNTSDTQTFTPNWHQRSSHASVVFDNKIWVLGGSFDDVNNRNSESIFFNDIWSWDNSQSDWIQER